MRAKRPKTLWVDLDNSPHVPFFNPIIKEMRERGIRVIVTARNHAQVCQLADLYQLEYTRIGRHYGKNPLMKVLGMFFRAMQMLPFTLYHKPDMAISHGSRAQLIATSLTRIPCALAFDYEHSRGIPFFLPTMVLIPESLPQDVVRKQIKHVAQYPGIKEDVYVSGLRPDSSIRTQLGVSEAEILATVRPPAMDAHYQNPESELLFERVMDHLMDQENLRIVILPRGDRQAAAIKKRWRDSVLTRKLIIPDHVMDGLNLIWHSDLVLSGGGTVIREAAALRVPAYSFFRGKTGNVDRYLSETGRLTMIRTPKDIPEKIRVERRQAPQRVSSESSRTLRFIVNKAIEVMGNDHLRKTNQGKKCAE